jgi:hypothetical protein
MWLIVSAFLAFWTLFAFGLAGPVAGFTYLAFVAICLGMAAGLWTGRGGRRVTLLSVFLGGALAVVGVAEAVFADPSAATSNAALALLGVAILLSSVALLRAQST